MKRAGLVVLLGLGALLLVSRARGDVAVIPGGEEGAAGAPLRLPLLEPFTVPGQVPKIFPAAANAPGNGAGLVDQIVSLASAGKSLLNLPKVPNLSSLFSSAAPLALEVPKGAALIGLGNAVPGAAFGASVAAGSFAFPSTLAGAGVGLDVGVPAIGGLLDGATFAAAGEAAAGAGGGLAAAGPLASAALPAAAFALPLVIGGLASSRKAKKRAGQVQVMERSLLSIPLGAYRLDDGRVITGRRFTDVHPLTGATVTFYSEGPGLAKAGNGFTVTAQDGTVAWYGVGGYNDPAINAERNARAKEIQLAGGGG